MSGGKCPGVSVLGGKCPGGGGVSARGGVSAWGVSARGVSVLGGK